LSAAWVKVCRGEREPGSFGFMSTIPLDLERRFEQRWAARFSRPEQAAALQKHLKVRSEPLDALLKTKGKERRVEPTDSQPAPAVEFTAQKAAGA
jgi:hypothetical protein